MQACRVTQNFGVMSAVTIAMACSFRTTEPWSHGALQYQEIRAGSAQAESCCVYVKPEKIMQHMRGIIPKLFDCWANPVDHLLLLKSSMVYLAQIQCYPSSCRFKTFQIESSPRCRNFDVYEVLCIFIFALHLLILFVVGRQVYLLLT